MSKPRYANVWSLYLSTPVPRPKETYLIVDTLKEAQRAMIKYGLPTHIDFDYWTDAQGIPKTGVSGFDLAHWIAENTGDYPKGFNVYSANRQDRLELERILGLRCLYRLTDGATG